MKVFNSISKNLGEFTPIEKDRILMYVCGLTPYDSAHIGHARTYVSFDVIKRYFLKKAFSVYHIQNITDVDDKIIKRCKETGANPKILTETNHSEALELLNRLNVLPADAYPKVTDHIAEIIVMIRSLIEQGSAYETPTGVYFSISTFGSYGSLSGQNIEEIRAGSRFEVDETKKDPADFALWKKTKGEIIEFPSPWGNGRPGWHIECSAMSQKYAKRTLDIHGGARDLIFPHHENEIAQSEAASNQKFCNYWLHTGFLTVRGEKMSKSLGNFITLRQALSTFSATALRLFYLQAHYRSPLDYDEEVLYSMEEGVERIFNSLGLIKEIEDKGDSHSDLEFCKKSEELIALFYSHMENDFNTPEALASLFTLLRLANSQGSSDKPDHKQLKKVGKAIHDMLWILGLEEKRPTLETKSEEIFALLDQLEVSEKPISAAGALDLLVRLREESRKKKDYRRSDLIRSRLSEIGIIIEDKPDGTRWKIA